MIRGCLFGFMSEEFSFAMTDEVFVSSINS